VAFISPSNYSPLKKSIHSIKSNQKWSKR
jgi:hypothetical protein